MKTTNVVAVFVLLLVEVGGTAARRQAPVAPAVSAAGAALPSPTAEGRGTKPIRATGMIRAARVYTVQVPRLQGQNVRITLVRLAGSGVEVEQGDVLAEFDRTEQAEAAREALAKYEDLGHQVEQKRAQNRSDAEKRLLDIEQAESDLAKALLELRKGPILSEIDRLKNEARAEGARGRLKSNQGAHEERVTADGAALRILELQQERQKVALERARNNAERMVVRAPLAGMVAHENVWRGGSMGPAQEGDQLFPGQTLMKIFDPSEMMVWAMINESDRRALTAASRALVELDAYPDAAFEGEFESASPVADSARGSPIKTFSVVFRLTKPDPRLLPDLSAAVLIHPEGL